MSLFGSIYIHVHISSTIRFILGGYLPIDFIAMANEKNLQWAHLRKNIDLITQ